MTDARPMLTAAEAALLADFARTFRTAARAATLYPSTHPAIAQNAARLADAASRLASGATLTVTVHPSTLEVGGGGLARADVATGELAAWLHERLIGVLRIKPAAATADWIGLLLALSRSPEDLRRDGGAARAIAAADNPQFDIHEIDYGEVLRERAGGAEAEWPRIIAYCLQDDIQALDERAIAALVATFAQPAKLLAFVDALATASAAHGLSAGVRAAGILQLLRRALEAISSGMGGLDAADGERILQSMSEVAPRLSPEMMFALLNEARVSGGEHRAAVDGIADFIANAVVVERPFVGEAEVEDANRVRRVQGGGPPR